MKLNAKLIRTVLKLTWFEELGQRGIADAAGVGKTTVLRIQKTAVENHITAETIENYDNAALEAIFTPRKRAEIENEARTGLQSDTQSYFQNEAQIGDA